MGSVPAPSTTSWIQPEKRVTGTSSVSTTRIHGRNAMDEKYSAAARACSAVAAAPMRIIRLGGRMSGSPVRRSPFR